MKQTVLRAILSILCLLSLCLFGSTDTYGDSLIADHTVVSKYADIPQYWIDQVKKMWLNMPDESHSVAYRAGLVLLAQQDTRFSAIATESGSIPVTGTPAPFSADTPASC